MEVAMVHNNEQANKLINEKSPYLLQHAYNPVDWYPWNEEAFEVANKKNKPFFLVLDIRHVIDNMTAKEHIWIASTSLIGRVSFLLRMYETKNPASNSQDSSEWKRGLTEI